jgi:DNA-binding response OmpR family regulator
MKPNTNILILDDDEDIGNVLKMMLEYKGYNVTLLDRVDKANEVVSANNHFQLLILDMLIAGDNGCDFCRDLKNNSELATLPVLMFSALPEGKTMAKEAGADDFIFKPFQMNEMLEKVSGMVTKAPQAK